VSVSAAGSSITVGQSLQLGATVRDAAGNALTGRTVTWSSSDVAKLTVSGTGLAAGASPGNASVTATSEGKSGSLALTVTAPILTAEATGLTGYVSGALNAQPAGFTYGFSSFASISTLDPAPAANTQLGWGTWIIPNNQAFTQPLCPVGTYARDNWPDRGPSYRDVFQTIEGGPGEWTSTKFPSSAPKFRMNSTPDCYTTEVATTGWSFYGSALPANRLGVVQLSNRLLAAPDGIVFTGASDPTLLGYAWLALPIIPAYTSPLGLAAGDQSWTLFLDAANFKGPVAFFTPEIWTEVAATDHTSAGRSMDAQPGITGSLALEIGNAPMFTSHDASGTRYRRIPRLTFPVAAGASRATLHQDMRYYSKAAIWNAVGNWIQNGVAATQMDPAGWVPASVTNPGVSLTIGGSTVNAAALVSSDVFLTPGGGQAWGIGWTAAATDTGVLPEYYREQGNTWTAVPASQVPRETWLADQSFTHATRGAVGQLDQSPSAPWASAQSSAGPFTAVLADGSSVDYVWYKFIDQPAIARLGLSAAVKLQLQTFVESLHEHSGVSGLTIAPPSSGKLATLDAAQIVTPPAGMEKGYVPVVIRQR
jgi:hypothetical protein